MLTNAVNLPKNDHTSPRIVTFFMMDVYLSASGMARQLRFVYSEVVYDVMACGDGGKKLFLTDSDHTYFRDWLDGVCKSRGWQLHAWVLMSHRVDLL